MSKEGYLYILIRADFVEKKQYVYKIGQTTRFPPHKRLWDYPYGSLFLSLFKTHSAIQFEKEYKDHLIKSPKLIWRKDIGVEYFEGPLQEIVDILINLYPQYIFEGINIRKLENHINDEYLLKLNRVHYIVNYDQSYFDKIYQNQFYTTDDIIKSEDIYDSYQRFRQWHAIGYPDNYVIRCGMSPIKPLKPVFYTVPPQVPEKTEKKKIKIKLKSTAEIELQKLFNSIEKNTSQCNFNQK